MRDYIYAMQNGRCACCGRPIEHFHHIVPRSKGRSDMPENIIGLCKSCHERLHKGDEEIKARLDKTGLKKKYGALSVLNQAIPYILDGLTDMFGAENVHGCYGFQTQEYRLTHDIGKDHPEDAVCISALGCGLDQVIDLTTSHEVQQFRRHDRQIIKAQRERTYKLDGVTVAKSRKPRSEQPKDCPALSVWYEERVKAVGRRQADVELSRLSAKRSTRSYNDLERRLPGTEVLYKGKRYIVKGKHNARYTLIGVKGDGIPISRLTFLKRDQGLVYLN